MDIPCEIEDGNSLCSDQNVNRSNKWQNNTPVSAETLTMLDLVTTASRNLINETKGSVIM